MQCIRYDEIQAGLLSIMIVKLSAVAFFDPWYLTHCLDQCRSTKTTVHRDTFYQSLFCFFTRFTTKHQINSTALAHIQDKNTTVTNGLV